MFFQQFCLCLSAPFLLSTLEKSSYVIRVDDRFVVDYFVLKDGNSCKHTEVPIANSVGSLLVTKTTINVHNTIHLGDVQLLVFLDSILSQVK